MQHLSERFFGVWGGVIARSHRKVLWLGLLLGLISLPLAIDLCGRLDADITNQVSEDLPRFKTLRELSKDFGGDLFVAVLSIPGQKALQSEAVEALRSFGKLFVSELRKVGLSEEDHELWAAPQRNNVEPANTSQPWLQQVECRSGSGVKEAIREIFHDYPQAVLRLQDVASLREKFEPEALQRRMKALKEELVPLDREGLEFKRKINDPLELGQLAEQAMQSRSGQVGWSSDDPDGYFLSKDRSTLLVLARPLHSAHDLHFNRALIAAVQRAENRAIGNFRAKYPNGLHTAFKTDVINEFAEGETHRPELSIGYTGMHAISVENARSMVKDVISTTGTTIILIVAVFWIVFKRIHLAVNIGATMLLASLVTMAIAALGLESLGVMGVGFFCVLIGMGVDYGIHIHNSYHHYSSERGLSSVRAMEEVIKHCGPGILTAALTTSIAFLGLSATDFKGLAQMGFMAGVGLLCAAFAMLTIFPALLMRGSSKEQVHINAAIKRTTVHLTRLHSVGVKPRIGLYIGVLVFIICIVIVGFFAKPGEDRVLGVRFDGEFGNLRSLNVQAIPLRWKVSEKFGQAVADLRVVIEAREEADVFDAANALKTAVNPRFAAGELSPGGGILDYMNGPKQQQQTIEALKAADLSACKKRFLDAAVEVFGPAAEGAFGTFMERMDELSEKTNSAELLHLHSVLKGPLGALLTPYARIDVDADGAHYRLAQYFFPSPQFLHSSQSWYDELVREMAAAAGTKSEIRVTSAKMVGYELKASIFHDIGEVSILVALLVIVFLIVTFRSFKKMVLAALPVVFGFLFVLCGVALSDLLGGSFALNYVNVMIFPVLLGSGIDYGVYLVYDAFSPKRPPLSKVLNDTGRAVLLCGITTLAGFGSMCFGSYTGLISFGEAALLGYAGSMFGALIVLPPLLFYYGTREGIDDTQQR